MLVAERGAMGTPPVALPEGELEAAELHRLIRPSQQVPQVLLQADRDYRHARENGLLGTSWLPAPSPLELAAGEAAIHQAAVTLTPQTGDRADDDEFFRRTFCDHDNLHPERRCHIRVQAPFTFRFGMVSNQDFVTGMINQGGSEQISYTTCWWRVGCKFSTGGAIPRGTWRKWKLRGYLRSWEQSIFGDAFSYARSIPGPS
jgi:hypothetical protein